MIWRGFRPSSAEERVAAQMALGDIPLKTFLTRARGPL